MLWCVQKKSSFKKLLNTLYLHANHICICYIIARCCFVLILHTVCVVWVFNPRECSESSTSQLCGYQSYGSCRNSLASEWGRRGGAEVDGKQICSSHLSFRCVHPSGPPGPSSLALPTGCVCLMLCRASSKTSYAAESLPICYFTPRLPEDLPNTYMKCRSNSDTSVIQ